MRIILFLLLTLGFLHLPIKHVQAAANNAVGDVVTTTDEVHVSNVSAVDTETAEITSEDEKVAPTEEEMVTAIKEILRISTERAVAKLARKDGFNKDPNVRINLPESLSRVRQAMVRLDNTNPVDSFELHMNRAAEHSTPKVAGYFILAINQIKIKEPETLLYGQNNSVTGHLETRMKLGLVKVVRPIIKDSMRFAGTYVRYEDLMEEYRKIPFEPTVRGDIENYMVNSIVDALFYYMNEEENAIRLNPKDHPRSTEIIKKVLITQ